MSDEQRDLWEQWEESERLAEQRIRERDAQRDAYERFAPPPELRSRRLAAVIEALKSGPKTTSDLKADDVGGHRFSTSIDELRQRGHQIKTEELEGGMALYTLLAFNPTVKVHKTMQEAYYASDHWQQVSHARKIMDGLKCVQCHSTLNLHTHHWVYYLFNESIQRDLITVCQPCHKTIHDRCGIAFPKWVTEDIARRLQ